MITYSTSSGSRPARWSAARIAIDPSSVAGYDERPPPRRPNGVRTAATMTEVPPRGACPRDGVLRAGVDPLRQEPYDVRTVAVTVGQGTPFVVLDDMDRIVEVGTSAQSQFGPLVGTVIWESFPGSEPLFKPYYDKARQMREPVEFV